MTPEQCRAAREALGGSRVRLASHADCTDLTVASFENGKRPSRPSTRQAIRAALEAAGVEFIMAKGGEPGVRLAAAAQSQPATPPDDAVMPGSNPPIDEDAT